MEINSSGFAMNGFMPEAFENPEGSFFENVDILWEGAGRISVIQISNCTT